VADRLLENLERRYLQLRDGPVEALAEEYRASLYRLDQPASFVRTADGSVFTGLIRGVTPEGRLRVESGAGEERFDLKEIRFL
jgi:BirA family biotin operon repressor/biotin-[acetyl-CoA-carboxylase] ligase